MDKLKLLALKLGPYPHAKLSVPKNRLQGHHALRQMSEMRLYRADAKEILALRTAHLPAGQNRNAGTWGLGRLLS